jgi:hypothetical protein
LCRRHSSMAMLGPVVIMFRLISGKFRASIRLVVPASRKTEL